MIKKTLSQQFFTSPSIKKQFSYPKVLDGTHSDDTAPSPQVPFYIRIKNTILSYLTNDLHT
ncbi:MAG: hypothetical protein AAF223_10815 [Bacteroidota bacterium]